MQNDYSSASAPSYALESDSDSELEEFNEEEGIKSNPTKSNKNKNAKIELIGEEEIKQNTSVIFFVGEAGERLDVSVKGEVVKIILDGEQVGAIQFESEFTLVFLTVSIQLSSLHPLSLTLLNALKPLNITILASYHFPSYITSATTLPDPDNPPILYLRSNSTPSIEKLQTLATIKPFQPPNLLHGLAASLLTISTLTPIDSLLLLFPTTTFHSLSPPWSNNSIETSNATSLYDIGPLAEKSGMQGLVNNQIAVIAKELNWNWLGRESQRGTKGEKGFSWLERIRKIKRREQNSSMYM